MDKERYFVIKIALILIFFGFGIFLRINAPYNILTNNVVGFYFSRAEYLEINNHNVKEDDNTFAGYPYKENYPPFPAYVSVPIYDLVKIFGVEFETYISYFPVLMYIAIFILGFFLIKSLFDLDTALFFIIIFSVIPAAVYATIKNYYTEEAFGMLLILISIYYLCRIKKFDSNFVFLIVTLTILALTWQVFILINFTILLFMLFYYKNRRVIMLLSLVIILPLVIGHIFSAKIIGIDYSPINMIKESLITVKESGEKHFQIAFDRNNLKTPGYTRIWENFGLLPIFTLSGFIFLFVNKLEQRNKFILIISMVGLIAFLSSTKFTSFALIPLAITSAVGARSIINLFFLKKPVVKVILILLIFAISIFVIFALYKNTAVPECKVELEAPSDIEKNNYYHVQFSTTNIGFDSKCDNIKGKDHVFGGIHVEFENAIILNSIIKPSQTNLSPKYRVGYENLSWFEALFDCLPRKETVNVSAWIMPKTDSIKINYRCWLPRKYCDSGLPTGLSKIYSSAWRNEDCLERFPKAGKPCQIRVFAGYSGKKDYYCESKEFI